ncbi:hypothetical protein FKM82_020086 [Ascaphus truei]
MFYPCPGDHPQATVLARVNTDLTNTLGSNICLVTSPVCVCLFTLYRISFDNSKWGNTIAPCAFKISTICTTLSYCLARNGSSFCLWRKSGR